MDIFYRLYYFVSFFYQFVSNAASGSSLGLLALSSKKYLQLVFGKTLASSSQLEAYIKMLVVGGSKLALRNPSTGGVFS